MPLRLDRRALLPALGDVLTRGVALLWFGWFLVAHIQGFRVTGKLSLALFAAAEGLIVLLFVLRRPPRQVQWHPVDVLAAFAGTGAALLFRPSDHPGLPGGEALIVIGLLAQLGSTASLGRSFGILPANRGVQTRGFYQFIRHPIYASYVILHSGYLLNNPTSANLGVAALSLTFQLIRIRREERVLFRDPEYERYAAQVRFRLLPGVY